MLEWALRKHISKAIQDYCQDEDDLETDTLTRAEWKMLGQIRDFLEAFYDATKAVEGSDKTVEEVIPLMDLLFNAYRDSEEEFSTDDRMGIMLTTGWAKLKKYYNKTDEIPVYIAALVLNPTIKWSYIEKEWPKNWVISAKQRLRSFWIKEYKSSAIVLPPKASEPNTRNSKDRPNRFTQWKSHLQPTADGIDEYQRYINAPPVPESNESSRDWWLQPYQREMYPNLSLMAINILSISASASDTERVFSGAKQSITDIRGSLQVEAINALECLKSWYKQEEKNKIVALGQATKARKESEGVVGLVHEAESAEEATLIAEAIQQSLQSLGGSVDDVV